MTPIRFPCFPAESSFTFSELLFQISAHCGVPAAVAARRGVKAVRAEREGA
ncbi:hypothetical protein ACFVW1_47540 [Streptomyces olivochromogenes]|uniref:hypothetical protein n=1 Tax=Streptomyces olivochromogenes TaxID=1963 RepID=UPI0036D81D27